jgi:hypothetical protein
MTSIPPQNRRRCSVLHALRSCYRNVKEGGVGAHALDQPVGPECHLLDIGPAPAAWRRLCRSARRPASAERICPVAAQDSTYYAPRESSLLEWRRRCRPRAGEMATISSHPMVGGVTIEYLDPASAFRNRRTFARSELATIGSSPSG